MEPSDHARQEGPLQPVVGPEFTDTARAALLWVLWHHQGAHSDVGQPIRFALGMGRHERLSDAQVAQARLYGELVKPKCKTCGGTGWNHGAQPGPGPGYKTIPCHCKRPNTQVQP